MPTQPVLVVHGGAWAIPDDMVEAHCGGVTRALGAGYALLSAGASATDAVVAAVTVLEDDETFDAGRGSFLTRDGRVQLDALLMDGATLRAGGVACVERIRNPIQAARLVMDQSPHVYFVGSGAEQFAAQHGVELIDNSELVLDRERLRLAAFQRRERAGFPDLTFAGDDKSPETAARAAAGAPPASHASPLQNDPNLVAADSAGWGMDSDMQSHDTVGAVALDAAGNIAAATSTGGTLNKAPGRVGDSSLIGCGCYADNASAAVSLTGWGEPIMKLVLGKWAVDRVLAGAAPEQAASEAIAYLHARLAGHGGIILLARDGRFGIAHNTPRMTWGVASAGQVQVGINL